MPVNIIQYRGEIGVYYNKCYNVSFSSISIVAGFGIMIYVTLATLIRYPFIFTLQLMISLVSICIKIAKGHYKKCLYSLCLIMFNSALDSWYYVALILLSHDVEQNPGPRQDLSQSFSISHWNLGSIPSHNFQKITSFIAFNCIHDFDIICFSETFLNSDISSEDKNLEIPGYTFFRKDHPSNTMRGGVCVYFKTYLPVKTLNISFLPECINFEINIGNKVCNFISLYRSPSQSNDQFQDFLKNFELNIETMANKNPCMVIVLGDFNCKSNKWYWKDAPSVEGNDIDYLTCQYGLKQLINEPTHVLVNSATCIDLIFCSQPNLVSESGVLSSLHSNCHHQIIYAKFNLKIHYPPPYEREIWHYNQGDFDLINQAIDTVNWDVALATDDVNDQVSVFNEIILNVMKNFIPHEKISCDERDPP